MIILLIALLWVLLTLRFYFNIRGPRVFHSRRRWIATPHGWVPEPTDAEFRQARENPGAMIERDAMPRARPGGESELPRHEW